MAVGDLDPNHPGDEIVLGDESHRVVMISGESGHWSATTLFVSPWSIDYVGIGDLDATNPGNEIVVVAMGPDGIQMIEDNNGDWAHPIVSVIANPLGQLWDFKVGDFDQSHPGDEACASWEMIMDFADVYIYSYSNSTWRANDVYSEPSPVMSMDVGDFNSSHPGNEIFMVNENTDHIQLIQNGTGWSYSLLWWGMFVHSGREVLVGDVDMLHPGSEIVVRERMDPKIHLLEQNGNTWTPVWIITGPSLFTDLAIGDMSMSHPGNEVMTISGATATIIMGTGQVWSNQTLWKNSVPLTCIAYGEFDRMSTGHEVAIADHSGSLKRIPYSYVYPL
jgi:hypothetical protein